MLRRLALAAVLGSLLAAAGCEPKCREVEAIADVEKNLRERIDDRLDEVDVGDGQRVQIQRLFAGLRPALVRLRERTLPRERMIVAELRNAAPDRRRLTEWIDENVDATQEYAHAVIDVMLQAHRVLTPEQRKALAARAAEPSPAFDGSFWIDRAVDYLLLRIDATAEQRRLFERIEKHLVERGRALQRRFDAIRAEAAAEFARDSPDTARIHAALERGRAPARDALVELAGFYLLFASKLEPRQRAILGGELVRFEPCSERADAVHTTADRPRSP